jgi:CubicO group peptidase (beta-lactamase class C family)
MLTITYFCPFKKLHFQPGSHSSYSIIGFVILQRVIEKASGMDYESYVLDEIFEPLHNLRCSSGK